MPTPVTSSTCGALWDCPCVAQTHRSAGAGHSLSWWSGLAVALAVFVPALGVSPVAHSIRAVLLVVLASLGIVPGTTIAALAAER